MSAPKRIQRKRTKGWRMPEGAVYVGRPTEWGNPWTVGTVATLEWPTGRNEVHFREVEITPHIAVALYRWAFTPDVDEIRAQLADRDLACWCPLDQPCHADVLLEIANGGRATMRELLANVWDEARRAKPQYLGPDNGHYNEDCMGWEDCYCASFPNPYRDPE